MSCKILISCPVDSWWFISVFGVLIWNLAWIKNHLSENLLLAAFIHFLLCKCSEATIYPSEGAFIPSVAHFYNVCWTVCVCVFVINRLDSFSFFWLKNDCRPTKPILHLWESWRRSWHCWKRLSRSFKLQSVASVDWNLFMQHIPRFWAKGQHLGLDFVNTTNNANPFLFSLYLCFPSGNTHLYFNFYFKIFKYVMYSK